MLVFYKENLVFLSVPKTGTTAYHSALQSRADIIIRDPPLLKHAPVYRYNRFLRPLFKQVCASDPEIMAVMREPISWLGSWYRYRGRPALHGHPNSTEGISFNAFVDAYCKGKPPDYAMVGSQANFLAPQPNGCAVTHLFRYEEQSRVVGFLSERLNCQITLGQENVSPAQDLELSAKTEGKLRRKFAADFDLYDSIA